MYDKAWQREESHEAAVVDGWKKGSGTMGLMSLNEALKDMQVHLTTWKGKKFGDVQRKIKKVRKEIEKEKARSLFGGSSPRERDLASQLNELLHREEIMARQRSQSDWLRAGDRNTGFFQAQAKARRSRNRINTLESGWYFVSNEARDLGGDTRFLYVPVQDSGGGRYTSNSAPCTFDGFGTDE